MSPQKNLGPLLPEESASRYSETPILAERVAAGELPPVDERLPAEPAQAAARAAVVPMADTGRMLVV